MAKDDLDTVDSSKQGKRKEHTIVFESETFFSLAKRKCKTFLTNITLEPVMLFYGIVGWVLCQKLSSFHQFTMTTFVRKKKVKSRFRSIDKVASSQLILDKTCLDDFGFSPEICSDLQHHKANNTVVQVYTYYIFKYIHSWISNSLTVP